MIRSAQRVPSPLTSAPHSLGAPELGDRVAAHREQRAGRALRALDALSGSHVGRPRPTSALDHALLQHVLERCSAAARSGDGAEARAALALWAGREELPRLAGSPTAEDGVLAVTAEHAVTHHHAGVDDPAHCVTAEAVVGAEHTGRQTFRLSLAEGWALAERAGFGPLLTAACGVAVRTGEQAPGLLPRSYTLSFLPATVFMEQPQDARTTGEVLVHESSHSWLNECLAAENAVLPTEPWVHSPWRGVPRPPHGILHAVFAFSNVVLYLAALQRGPGGADADRSERLAAERRILTTHRRDIDTVLALVPSPAVRALVGERLSLALEALSPHDRLG